MTARFGSFALCASAIPLWLGLILAVSLPIDDARALTTCFSGSIEESADAIEGASHDVATEYMLGIDKILERVVLRFFPDGRVCGINRDLNIRFEGTNPTEGQLRLAFLAPPALAPEERDSSDDFVVLKKYAISLFGRELSGEARKQMTSDLILWDGVLRDGAGKQYDFYLKRPRPSARVPVPSNSDPINHCGDGGCDPLKIVVSVKPGGVPALRQDARQLPITKIEPVKDDICPYIEAETKKGDTCLIAMTWPFEEAAVVNALKRKPYVRAARRYGGAAGADTDSFFIKSDSLLSQNLRLNVSVAVPLFHDAITKYFDGTGLSVSDPIARQNSLFWEFKGRRAQFEKNPRPSPSDRSEWWKVRLQVAITEGQPGTYVLVVGLPETRTFAWALDSVPNDEKFTTELTNDKRFLDLQGRLMVAMTKFVAAVKD